MAAYRIAIISDDIGKFGYNSMQQRTKKDKIYEKFLTFTTFKVKFLTCNVFVLSLAKFMFRA